MSHRLTAMVTLTALAAAPTALAQWVNFQDVTSQRLPAALNDPALTVNDNEEKDYAWGDLDQDGDIDLVIVRKQPFTSTGKRVNVLLMNEGIAEGHSFDGVFVDRTLEYATASDVAGDNGFMTATNDRDVAVVDVDGDGWLDLVTAPTLTDNQAKNLSHPRVYMNLGEIAGEWQGFRYEDARIPQMHPNAGPRFCSVAAGDVTGDGAPDLYFGDYDSGGSQIFDYNNKLLINDGNGFFVDESDLRLTSEMRLSAFGAASVIADMNNDGSLDVVKQTSLNAPTHVAVTYNRPDELGTFYAYDVINNNAPYFVSVGDLNNDGRMDVVVVDDSTDTYLLNQGNGSDGLANFSSVQFPSGPSAGFGGNSFIADLDNDGFNDIIVTDVDVDIPGCSRVTAIYENDGNVPNVGFAVSNTGIPTSELTGVHDVAVFDIDGDGWLDLILGQCDGMKIYRNDPPQGVDYGYPAGRPELLVPGEPTPITISVEAIGGDIETDSLQLRYAVNGGEYLSTPFAADGDVFTAELPGINCLSTVDWFVTAMVNGSTYNDPPGGAFTPYSAIAVSGTETMIADSIEGDTSEWRVSSSDLTIGEWEPATPNGTINQGNFAAPFEDATIDGTDAFVTSNGVPGGAAGANDVDGGPATLESPVFDGLGDPVISFRRWFYCSNGDDVFEVALSTDGGDTYTAINSLNTSGTNGVWELVTFRVSDHVTPSDTMRVRFRTSDNPNNSITEAGVDDFLVEMLVCEGSCPTDVDGSGATDFADIVSVLAAFGAKCTDCAEDVNADGNVDFSDVIDILAAFGPCS